MNDSLGYAVTREGDIFKTSNGGAPVGIPSLTNPDDPGFSVFPDPFKDKVTIKIHKNRLYSEIEIFDQLGQAQYKSPLPPDKNQLDIDTSQWKPGVYIVKVILDEGILVTEKIVKI